ncbi:MAG: aminoglycoside phosphotransferase family protein [Oscillospiraceae bacterium]|nr:aminoglycoside phosphotransferase family protein [Oscillospiraceae bacterium]
MVEKELDIEAVRRAAAGYFREPFTFGDVPRHWSTHVYAVYAGGKIYYLRILPEDASFAVEVHAHNLLRDSGVTVPRVLHWEHKNSEVGLSLMIEAEIPGASVEQEPPGEHLEQILREAGRQIARAHQIPVDGFGFLDRRYYTELKGEADTFAAFYLAPLEEDIRLLKHYPFTADEIHRMNRLLQNGYERLGDVPPRLAHGDFDLPHIFHHCGRLSGLIDWGEMRGAPLLYDLATFRLEDKTPDGAGYRAVVDGYGEIYPLKADDLYNIELLALWQGVHRLRMIDRPMNHEYLFPLVKSHLGRITG